MTSTDRVIKHRAEAAKQGRKRKEYLVTDDEHAQIKSMLKAIRSAYDAGNTIPITSI